MRIVRHQRRPHVRRIRHLRAPRQHTHHRVRLALQQNRLAQNAGVLMKCRPPQPVAQHRSLARARPILIFREPAPQQRLNAQHLEVMRRDARVVDIAHSPTLRRARFKVHALRVAKALARRSPLSLPGTSCFTARHASLSEESSSSKFPGFAFDSSCATNAAIRSGCGYGRVRSRNPSSRLNTAVFTPIASASVTTTAAANPGLRCNCRKRETKVFDHEPSIRRWVPTRSLAPCGFRLANLLRRAVFR